MYIVTIKNGSKTKKIHCRSQRLASGNVVQGINSIDSFTFTILPNNVGFDLLSDFTTLVTVFNTNKNKYEFYGRVLCSTPSMSDSGLISKDVTCESYFGFLCDSQQLYKSPKNWTVKELFTNIVNTHNYQIEPYKRFVVGEVTVTDPDDNLYCGIDRKNTWDTIKEKLIDKLGGELRFRVDGDVIYIDYLERIGEEKTTEIALSKNMKSITKEKDPSAYITRLIPLGAKIGEDTEERLDITEVNGGNNYIDDELAIAEYGLHVGYVEFDDVTDPNNLLAKGRNWLKNNNKVLIKYSITALDLSLIGYDIDDFEVHNYHPIKNKLLNIDDIARITKKNIDICEETKSSFEIGESFKTLSDIQKEQYDSLGKINADIVEIKRDYATNETLVAEITKTKSLISQTAEEIVLFLEGEYVTETTFDTYTDRASAELALKVGVDEKDRIVSMLNASADSINLNSNRLTISSDFFELSADGIIKATAGEIGGATIEGGILQIRHANLKTGSIAGMELKENRLESVTKDESESILSSTVISPEYISTSQNRYETKSSVMLKDGQINISLDGSAARYPIFCNYQYKGTHYYLMVDDTDADEHGWFRLKAIVIDDDDTEDLTKSPSNVVYNPETNLLSWEKADLAIEYKIYYCVSHGNQFPEDPVIKYHLSTYDCRLGGMDPDVYGQIFWGVSAVCSPHGTVTEETEIVWDTVNYQRRVGESVFAWFTNNTNDTVKIRVGNHIYDEKEIKAGAEYAAYVLTPTKVVVISPSPVDIVGGSDLVYESDYCGVTFYLTKETTSIRINRRIFDYTEVAFKNESPFDISIDYASEYGDRMTTVINAMDTETIKVKNETAVSLYYERDFVVETNATIYPNHSDGCYEYYYAQTAKATTVTIYA